MTGIPQEKLGTRVEEPLTTTPLEYNCPQSPADRATPSALGPCPPTRLSDPLELGVQKGQVSTYQFLAPSFREQETHARRGGVFSGKKPPPPRAPETLCPCPRAELFSFLPLSPLLRWPSCSMCPGVI